MGIKSMAVHEFGKKHSAHETLLFAAKILGLDASSYDGGPGSGNFGHKGRPGKRGGSSKNGESGGGSGARSDNRSAGGPEVTGSPEISRKEPSKAVKKIFGNEKPVIGIRRVKERDGEYLLVSSLPYTGGKRIMLPSMFTTSERAAEAWCRANKIDPNVDEIEAVWNPDQKGWQKRFIVGGKKGPEMTGAPEELTKEQKELLNNGRKAFNKMNGLPEGAEAYPAGGKPLSELIGGEYMSPEEAGEPEELTPIEDPDFDIFEWLGENPDDDDGPSEWQQQQEREEREQKERADYGQNGLLESEYPEDLRLSDKERDQIVDLFRSLRDDKHKSSAGHDLGNALSGILSPERIDALKEKYMKDLQDANEMIAKRKAEGYTFGGTEAAQHNRKKEWYDFLNEFGEAPPAAVGENGIQIWRMRRNKALKALNEIDLAKKVAKRAEFAEKSDKYMPWRKNPNRDDPSYKPWAKDEFADDGGPGSGNFGHKGRPGKVGGSGAGGGKQYRGGRADIGFYGSRKDWLNGLTGEKQHEAAKFIATAKRVQFSYRDMYENMVKKGEISREEADKNIKEFDEERAHMTPEEYIMKIHPMENDKKRLVDMMAEARSWPTMAKRLVNENLSDDEKKLFDYFVKKHGDNVPGGATLPNDLPGFFEKWPAQDRVIWLDLKSKALGGPTSGEPIPDEMQYAAGIKERPKPPEPVEPVEPEKPAEPEPEKPKAPQKPRVKPEEPAAPETPGSSSGATPTGFKADNLPRCLKKKPTEALIKALDKIPGRDQKIQDLYSRMGEFYEKNMPAGIGVQPTYTDGEHYFGVATYTFTGVIARAMLKIPKMTKEEHSEVEAATTVHELGHMLDFLFRADRNMGGNLSQQYKDKLNEIVAGNTETTEEMEQNFVLAETRAKLAGKEVQEQYKAKFDDIGNQISEALRNKDYDSYQKLAKQRNALYKEEALERDRATRKAVGGWSCLMDMYNAIGDKHRMFGHRFKGDTERLAELWANWCELSLVYPEERKILEKEKPVLCKMLNEISDDITRRMGEK